MIAESAPPFLPSAAAKPSPALRIGTIAGALYLALLPFGHLTAVKNLCLVVAFVCALILWRSNGDKRVPLIPAFAVWLTAGAISLLWSHDLDSSLSALWRDVVKTALVFFTFFIMARGQASASAIARIAVVGAAAFALLAMRDFMQNGWWENVITPARYDVSVDALHWMVFIGMMIPVIGYHPAYRKLQWFSVLTLVLLVVAGVMTQSRSFNLSVILCLILFAAMNYHRIARRKAALAMAIGVIAAGAVLAIVLLDRPIAAYLDRWFLYSTVWQKISANLWQGTGFGHETDQAWYRATFDHFPVPGVPTAQTHPHNLVLSYMDQMGIWGLAVLVFIFWVIGKRLWVATLSIDRWRVRLGQAGLLLLLITVVSNSFNCFFVRQHLWMLFAMLGLYFGWIRGERRPI